MKTLAFAILFLSVSAVGPLVHAGHEPYARYKHRIVKALTAAQKPGKTKACRKFKSARLVKRPKWRALSKKPTAWTAPGPAGIVATRAYLPLKGIAIEWRTSPRPDAWGSTGWGVVTLTKNGRKVRIEIPGKGAPSPRGNPVVAIKGTNMVVWGGSDQSGLRNDGGVFDFRKGVWKSVTIKGAPSARAHATAAWVGDRLFVWGGGAPKKPAKKGQPAYGVDYFTDGGVLDVKRNRWTAVPAPKGLAARRNGFALGSREHVALLAGEGQWQWPYQGGHAVNDGAVFHLKRGTWSVFPVPFWGYRHAMSVVELPDGWYATYDHKAGLFLLDPVAGELHPVPMKSEATGRLSAEVFPTCRGLVIYGGKTMVNPGGGCENHTGPQGCDPVPPAYAGFSDGWLVEF